MQDIQNLIDFGYVEEKDVELIAKFLGIQFTVPPRSTKGRLYELAYHELLRLGLCTACAANAAGEYVNNPNSYLGQLVERAFQGDVNAINLLLTE